MSEDEGPAQALPIPVPFGPTVTILFTDIRGFTEFTDAHGDEAAYRMLQHHNKLVEERIAEYGGQVVKTLGDSFMVSFDAARTAVACAVGIQRAVDQYNGDNEDPQIEIGVGVNTGEPVREAGDYFGGAVNLASRICAAAGPEEIMVSETVRQVVGKVEGTEWLDRGLFQLKGFEQPQRLFEVVWSDRVAERATSVSIAARSAASSRRSRRRWLLLAPLAALVAALGVAGAVRLSALDRGEGQPASVAPVTSGPRLLRGDDFSNPGRGLFEDRRRGTTRATTRDGLSYEFTWEYAYAENAMIGRLWGPYSEHEGRFFPYEGTPAADRLLVDFAVEVVAQATKTVERARYGIEYVVEGDDRYRFEIAPAPQQYGIMLGPQRRNFMASDRSSAVNRAGEENHLRMEVQGDTIRVYVNGQLVDQAQHEGLARRGGTIELVVGMYGPPGDNEVEVRFADFRLYALDPQVL